ncbi:hypothetical protein HYX00_02395 [Candidatus Woesearchaeota archaeon]|nr:hypothetical protein [Candidatus Woesearchaeota archaeon]
MKKYTKKDIIIGYLLAPIFLVLLVIVAKYIEKSLFQIDNEPFIHIFIPLGITFFLMGIFSLILGINTFLWFDLLFDFFGPSYNDPGHPNVDTGYPVTRRDLRINRFLSITFIMLGLTTIIISSIILFKFKTFLF